MLRIFPKDRLEKESQLKKNICMRRIITTLAIFVFLFTNNVKPVSCEENNESETIDIQIRSPQESQEEEMFSPVDLDLTDYTQMNKQNKKFKIKVEKEEKPTYVRASGQVWDTDKLYRYQYYSDEQNTRLLPSYGSINSFVTRDLDENTRIMIGQDGIGEVGGIGLNFFKMNNSYFSNGGRIDGKTKNLNYTVGSYMETDTTNNAIAAAVSTKPVHILNSKGTFSFGGGVFNNIKSTETKTTTGVFGQYNNGRFSLGTQFSQSQFSEGSKPNTNMMHVLPQFNVNKHLTLKTKLVKDMDFDEMQGEIGITIRPLKNVDALSFDLSATNYQSQNIITRQRLKFSTEFRF